MSLNQNLTSNDFQTATMNASCFQEPCSFNTSRIPGERTRMTYPCGYCDMQCTYRAIKCIFTLGIIANAMVVSCVARDRKLRNATFVSIAACAAADMCFLIIELVLVFEEVILTITCDYPGRIRQHTYKSMKVVAWFTSNGHVALLAVVRYVILVYPIKAKIYLSTRRVLLLSVLVWAIAFLSSLVIGLLSFISGTTPSISYQLNLGLWTTVYLAPGMITVMLHLAKIYNIRQTTTVTTNEQVRVMSRTVLLVIFVGAVLPFPFVLDRSLKTFGKKKLRIFCYIPPLWTYFSFIGSSKSQYKPRDVCLRFRRIPNEFEKNAGFEPKCFEWSEEQE